MCLCSPINYIYFKKNYSLCLLLKDSYVDVFSSENRNRSPAKVLNLAQIVMSILDSKNDASEHQCPIRSSKILHFYCQNKSCILHGGALAFHNSTP